MKAIGVPWLLVALSVALLGFAVSCSWTAAGLGFDIIGALTLLLADLRSDSALSSYLANPSHPQSETYIASIKTLPWYRRSPLVFGSKIFLQDIFRPDILKLDVTEIEEGPLDESLPQKFWSMVFLVVGFTFQFIGTFVDK